ncbi:MAG: RNA polymerase sigma-I factor [Bacillota bacterium]|nr:RNA polymerase sigma-I factor [Bacillota bacterium]
MLWHKNKNSDSKNEYVDISDTIDKIKSGNNELREKFIENYRPFILSCASKAIRKYVEVENSEEFSIALMAFNEAIDKFDKTKKQHFLSFSELVIIRRLINYKNMERRNSNVYPFSYFEENECHKIENSVFEDLIVLNFDRFEVKEEIIKFSLILRKFGITMEDLIKNSPKHRDSKKMMIEIAQVITQNDNLYQKLVAKKRIPMSELESYIKVHKRTLERNRKYIIAACLVLKSDMEIIKEFLKG